MSDGSTDVDIELAVRRYLGRLARRYTPLLVVGVTLALILVLVRPATTTKSNAVRSDASSSGTPGEAVPGPDDQYLADLRTYVDFFNKTFELYGRHVVVKDFTGSSDNLEESQGRSLAGAQADAAKARAAGAFVDITQSPTLASTQPYEEGLAHERVIAIGAVGLSQSWHEQYAPYEYSFPITP